jgi:DnaD/phage-associated family protein
MTEITGKYEVEDSTENAREMIGLSFARKPQTVFRVIHDPDNPYVMIDKRPLEKPYMSWKAKGMLSYLLSRPNDWTVRLGDLVKRSTDKLHATRQALRELILVGHVRQVEYRYKSGKYAGTVYEVHELPLYENPLAVFPKAEKRILNNIDSTKKEDVNEQAHAIAERTALLSKLYSENIGAITPLMADLIRNMTIDYPDPSWYQPAFEIAVKNNARNLNYVDAVLGGWKKHYFGWKPERTKSNSRNGRKSETPTPPPSVTYANAEEV